MKTLLFALLLGGCFHGAPPSTSGAKTIGTEVRVTTITLTSSVVAIDRAHGAVAAFVAGRDPTHRIFVLSAANGAFVERSVPLEDPNKVAAAERAMASVLQHATWVRMIDGVAAPSTTGNQEFRFPSSTLVVRRTADDEKFQIYDGHAEPITTSPRWIWTSSKMLDRAPCSHVPAIARIAFDPRSRIVWVELEQPDPQPGDICFYPWRWGSFVLPTNVPDYTDALRVYDNVEVHLPDHDTDDNE
jgi:hypothetical protein